MGEKIKVEGFTVYLKKPDGKFYASRRINGRLYTVYVGSSPENAAEKIAAYCKRKGLSTNTNINTNSVSVVSELEERLSAAESENKRLQGEIDTLTERLMKLEGKLEGKLERVAVQKRAKAPQDGDMKALCQGRYKEIALAAGVAKSSVSRYFDGGGKPETREKIRAAITAVTGK